MKINRFGTATIRKSTATILTAVVASVAFCRVVSAANDDEAPLTLTNLSQVRALTASDLAQRPHVQLDAVVTLSLPNRSYLWIQDGQAGSALYIRGRRFPVKPGDRVSVTGTAVRGENSPQIAPDQIKVLGSGDIPEAAVKTGRELASFADIDRRVQVEGHVVDVLSNAWHLQIEIESGTNRVWLDVPRGTNDDTPALAGAQVRARGVCVRRVLAWGDEVDPALMLQAMADVHVVQTGHPTAVVDPDSIPVTPIARVAHEALGSKSPVHVQGRVLDQRLGERLVVRDNSGTVMAESAQMTVAPLEAEVDVWGTPASDGARTFLQNATYRVADTTNTTAAVEGAAEPPATNSLEPTAITQVQQMLELSPQQAAWRIPVNLRGVVTLFYPQRRQMFVQDDSGGVAVYGQWSRNDLKTGDFVEVSGVTGPGSFAPLVVPSRVTALGTAPLPQPHKATLFQLASGRYDSQWVEIHGVVRSVVPDYGLVRVQVNDPDGSLVVYVPSETTPTNLVDSVVRIRGVCSARPNARRQINNLVIWTPSFDFVRIEEAGVADPLSLPTRNISSLSQFRPRDLLPRRLKVSGVVTLRSGTNSFFVQDGTDGIHVDARSISGEIHPGDQVEAAGYPVFGDNGNVLNDSVCVVLGHPGLPEARAVAATHALDPLLQDMRVKISARLVNYTALDNMGVLTLQVPGWIFEAHCLTRLDEGALPPAGSIIRVTGVYRVVTDETRTPSSFQILASSMDDLEVVSRPSWFTLEKSLGLLGLMTVGILAAALWAISMRRQVRERTASLRESESKFRSLVEDSLVGVYIVQDARFAYVNPRMAAIFGYGPEELAALSSVDDCVIPDDREMVREHIRRRITGETNTSHYNFRGQCKDGSIVHVEVLGTTTTYAGKPAVLGTAMDVTERKRTDEELFKSRQMLRTVLDTVPQRVFWKDRDSIYVGCNKPFAEDCGLSDPGQVVGKTDREAGPAALADHHRTDDLAVMASGHARIGFEEPRVRSDGTTGWLKTSKVPLFDQDGKIIGVLGTYEDITERKQAEAALAEASTLLETLLENSPDHIYFKDVESRFVHYSRSFSQLLHLPSGDSLKGKSDFDIFTEEHARPAYEDEQHIMRTGEPIIGKLERETHMDGSTTWALTNKLAWRDQDGNVIGTFGISKDVTLIKEAEQKLAYERELFQTLLDSVPDTIYFKDHESRFVRVSKSKVRRNLPAARSIYLSKLPPDAPQDLPPGLRNEDEFAEYIIGKTDFETMEPSAAQAAWEEEQKILQTGNPLVGFLQRQLAMDGSQRWFLITKMPWYDKDGKMIGTFGTSSDVTALKEAEARLEEAHQRVIETSRLAGMAEVATDVLHNVGNVLNSVNVSGSLIIDRVKTSRLSNLAKVSQLLQENHNRLADFLANDTRGRQIPAYLVALAEYSTSEQAALVQELEQLTRHIDHIKQIVAMQQNYAKVAGVLETVSPAQLVDDAIQINAAALKRHQVQIARDYAIVPHILTEKHRVLQILVNLIRNAKYAIHETGREDGLLTMRVGSDGNGGIQIQAIDNGVGIPEENLIRIFSHGFTTRQNGHGFGLHSSALAVRELGGSLEAYSEGPGHGATFTLILPQKPPKTTP